ncbi:MAG: helix-turn-helix domain-containing protein [Bacilli bacterium]
MENIFIQNEKLKNLQIRFGIDEEIFYISSSSENFYRTYTTAKQDFLSLIFFEFGNGIHIIDNERYTINNMQAHILLPGQYHRWELEKKFEVHQLFISKKNYENLFSFMQFSKSVYKKNPVISLMPNIFYQIVQECKDIEEEINDGYIINENIIYTKVKIILQNLDREIQSIFNNMNSLKEHPILFNFYQLIQKNYKTERRVSFYAKKLGVTANYLNVLSRKYLDKTASDVILEEILKHLKKHLLDSKYSFTDIAFDFGFQDYGTFSRCIKRRFGLTPRDIRKAVLV